MPRQKPHQQHRGKAASGPSYVGDPIVANSLAFFTGLCVMVLELVAGRLIARHLGSSLYTWTAVIGVILAGLSLGNWLGGRLADRFRIEQLVGKLFLAASITCLLILWLSEIMATAFPDEGISWPARIVCFVTVVFFVPAAALGTITPVLAKAVVQRASATGRAIGNIYAAGTIGSIVGTFLTGFVLIAWLGTKAIVLCVAAGLAGAGLVCGGRGLVGWTWSLLCGLACVGGLVATGWAGDLGRALLLREWSSAIYTDESHYFYIQVAPDPERPEVRALRLDALVHGSLIPDQPQELVHYGYERAYASLTARFAHDRDTLRALFIGGGAYVFPRYMEALYPSSQLDVVEIDPAVTEACHRALGLPRDTPIRSIHMDARNYVAAVRPGNRYDLIFGDAFNDFSVPWHLTTKEFNDQLRGLLAPDGLYMMNLVDIFNSGQFLAAYVHTARETFSQVRVLLSQSADQRLGMADWRDRREAFVVLCAQQPLVLENPPLGSQPGEPRFEGLVLSDQLVAELLNRVRPVSLTDDYAPVDNLLAPVIGQRGL
ncbi:MAG: fused MFS/spermidine synthase [Planctomycetes bacterium]|nr:fused MFS/spermidine synthase [Planctomycetota bacterium]